MLRVACCVLLVAGCCLLVVACCLLLVALGMDGVRLGILACAVRSCLITTLSPTLPYYLPPTLPYLLVTNTTTYSLQPTAYSLRLVCNLESLPVEVVFL